MTTAERIEAIKALTEALKVIGDLGAEPDLCRAIIGKLDTLIKSL